MHAVLLDRETTATSRVSARYVIAADGAQSLIREQLGIGMDGPDHLADYERVEFSAPLAGVAGPVLMKGLTSVYMPEPADGMRTARHRGQCQPVSLATKVIRCPGTERDRS